MTTSSIGRPQVQLPSPITVISADQAAQVTVHVIDEAVTLHLTPSEIPAGQELQRLSSSSNPILPLSELARPEARAPGREQPTTWQALKNRISFASKILTTSGRLERAPVITASMRQQAANIEQSFERTLASATATPKQKERAALKLIIVLDGLSQRNLPAHEELAILEKCVYTSSRVGKLDMLGWRNEETNNFEQIPRIALRAHVLLFAKATGVTPLPRREIPERDGTSYEDAWIGNACAASEVDTVAYAKAAIMKGLAGSLASPYTTDLNNFYRTSNAANAGWAPIPKDRLFQGLPQWQLALIAPNALPGLKAYPFANSRDLEAALLNNARGAQIRQDIPHGAMPSYFGGLDAKSSVPDPLVDLITRYADEFPDQP